MAVTSEGVAQGEPGWQGLLFLLVVLRVKFFCTLGADTMGEIHVRPVQNRSFYLLPVSPIVPYLVAI